MTKAKGASQVISGIITAMLRPVIRLCLRHSLKLGDLIEMAKIAFIQVAQEDLKRLNHEVSMSRLTAVTGVHRKDATRISRSGGAFEPPDNLLSRIMVQWQHDKRFTTKEGKPGVLSAEGRESEFAQLVESVNGGNLSAYAVLYEMERIGAVQRDGNRVKLCWRDFVIEDNVEHGLGLLAGDTNDLAGAVEENIFDRPAVPNLHLKTEFDNIEARKIPEIRGWLLEQGSLFHKRAREYLSQFDCDMHPSSAVKKACKRVVYSGK